MYVTNPCFPTFFKAISLLPMEMTDYTSDYEFLCAVIAKMRELVDSNNNLNNGVTQLSQMTEQEFAKLKTELDELESEFEKIKTGQYNDFYVDLVKQYISEHLTDDFFADKIKHLVPGLTNDGHFVIYVPTNWGYLHFDTIMNPRSDLFGHLVFRW